MQYVCDMCGKIVNEVYHVNRYWFLGFDVIAIGVNKKNNLEYYCESCAAIKAIPQIDKHHYVQIKLVKVK